MLLKVFSTIIHSLFFCFVLPDICFLYSPYCFVQCVVLLALSIIVSADTKTTKDTGTLEEGKLTILPASEIFENFSRETLVTDKVITIGLEDP